MKWLALALLLCAPSVAQEALTDILDRGHVEHWLVCGPFEPDADGGIGAALSRREAPLGTRDYMAPVGGVAALQPRHLLAVPRAGAGEPAYWQRAGTEGPTLDLGPFFPDMDEGVAYAAFLTEVEARQPVLCDLQTPLGARVWLNGRPARTAQYEPISAAGLDRFILVFNPGVSRVVMEVPGMSFDALAEATGMAMRELRATAFNNRPLLEGASGFEIALKLYPAAALGDWYYVPRLDFAETFSGTVNDLRQDMELRVFNATRKYSPAFTVLAAPEGFTEPMASEIPPIAPASLHVERLAIPVSGRTPGQTLDVEVTLSAAGASASFTDTVQVRPSDLGGAVFLVTGYEYAGEGPEDQADAAERRIAAFARQLILTEREPDYGFDLGPVTGWKPVLTSRPDLRGLLRQAVARGRTSGRAAYAAPDQRVVCGETLLRNLQYGINAGEALLGGRQQGCLVWDAPGMAPQFPQLARRLELPGLVSNLHVAGLPPLFRHTAPGGGYLYHRRKAGAEAPGSLEGLRRLATLHRRDLAERGIAEDVMVVENVTQPPESFYFGSVRDLARSYPAIRVDGSGAYTFFERFRQISAERKDSLPACARAMHRCRPGEVLAQPAAKRAHARVESRLLTAEKLATFATLFGAEYPAAALDLAWRQLMYWSAPDRLGLAPDAETCLDTLAGYRDAAESVDGVLEKAGAYLAEQVNTLGAAPSGEEGARAIVVFNPCSWPRTDVCEAEVDFEQAAGVTLVDDTGGRPPFETVRMRYGQGSSLSSARLRFLARDVPALGYRTYYVLPRGTPPQPQFDTEPAIENEFIMLRVDPATGDIVSLVTAKDGAEHAGGTLNSLWALEQDPDQIDGGAELWTTGETARPSGPPQIERSRSAFVQELRVSNPLLNGTVVRTLRLYAGVPRVDCTVRLNGVTLEHRVLAVSFDTGVRGAAPMFGERYGAMVGRRSVSGLDYRTDGMDIVSGTGAQPALYWSALSANDRVQTPGGRAVPLAPAVVVHGAAPALLQAARQVQAALVRRGIPALALPADLPKQDQLWTDATLHRTLSADPDEGTSMRILVGGPGQNAFTGALLERIDAETRDAFLERVPRQAPLLVGDVDVPEGYPPVPALVLAGPTPTASAALAKQMAEQTAANGVYTVAEAAMAEGLGEVPAERGLAVLHPGARICSVEPDGRLVCLLAHGTGPCVEEDARLAPDKARFDYALYPFAEDWRTARVAFAARGYAHPLPGIGATVHGGTEKPVQSLVELAPPDFIVTAVRPSGSQYARMRSAPVHPRDGFIVRGFEPHGAPWKGRLTLFRPLSDAAAARRLAEAGRSIDFTDNYFTHSFDGFEVGALWLLPSSRFPVGERAPAGRTQTPYGPVHTAYWKYNAGAAPMGALPVSVALSGNTEQDNPVLTAAVANNLTDKAIEGVLYLRASEDWHLPPEQHYYKLEPGAIMQQEVVVPRLAGASETGGIEAWTVYGGQTYRDTLTEGGARVTLDVSRNEAQVKATVRNLSGTMAEGYADLIVPPRYWPELGGAPETNVLPRRAAVSVPPFETQEILFRFSSPDVATWAAVKLAANGQVRYAYVE